MRLEVELTDQELGALELLARGRQIRLIAMGSEPAPEDRAIAKILLASKLMENLPE